MFVDDLKKYNSLFDGVKRIDFEIAKLYDEEYKKNRIRCSKY